MRKSNAFTQYLHPRGRKKFLKPSLEVKSLENMVYVTCLVKNMDYGNFFPLQKVIFTFLFESNFEAIVVFFNFQFGKFMFFF